MPATEQPAETGVVARAYFEAVAARDLDAMTSFYEAGGTGEIHGLVELTVPDSYRAWFANLFAAFPDFHCDVLRIRNGKIHRNDAYMNGAQMAQQLGALPPTGSLPERAMLAALNLKTRIARSLRR